MNKSVIMIYIDLEEMERIAEIEDQISTAEMEKFSKVISCKLECPSVNLRKPRLILVNCCFPMESRPTETKLDRSLRIVSNFENRRHSFSSSVKIKSVKITSCSC